MLYGINQEVEHLKMDMRAQKFKFVLTSPDGKEKKEIWTQGSLRSLPFGIDEYVFPREYLDVVLNTLDFDKKDARYDIGSFKMGMLRRMLKCKPIPKEFDKSKIYIWIKDNVAIIPIGIREDADVAEPDGELKGWTHEAL